MPTAIQHHIRRLNITVNNPLFMGIIQSIANTTDNPCRFIIREIFPFLFKVRNTRLQVTPFNVLHRHIKHTAVFPIAIQTHNIGML